MREIRFRLRNGKTILGYEKWSLKSGKGFWCYSKDGINWQKSNSIPHAHKDEYIGLKDKKRTFIYEGDIVKFDPKDNCFMGMNKQETWDKSIVKFEDGIFHFSGQYGYEGCKIDFKRTEVIGNIYENPELLEAK